ncbi:MULTISPECIES: hypothetical protein [unclassified Methylobacterium]|uniref:hypothetical protein n=1 Tax=unclassified Methylobacterium TaxID=2615210 RepID=UPI0036F6BC09
MIADPPGTSQACPDCGMINAKTRAIRTHACEWAQFWTETLRRRWSCISGLSGRDTAFGT